MALSIDELEIIAVAAADVAQKVQRQVESYVAKVNADRLKLLNTFIAPEGYSYGMGEAHIDPEKLANEQERAVRACFSMLETLFNDLQVSYADYVKALAAQDVELRSIRRELQPTFGLVGLVRRVMDWYRGIEPRLCALEGRVRQARLEVDENIARIFVEVAAGGGINQAHALSLLALLKKKVPLVLQDP